MAVLYHSPAPNPAAPLQFLQLPSAPGAHHPEPHTVRTPWKVSKKPWVSFEGDAQRPWFSWLGKGSCRTVPRHQGCPRPSPRDRNTVPAPRPPAAGRWAFAPTMNKQQEHLQECASLAMAARPPSSSGCVWAMLRFPWGQQVALRALSSVAPCPPRRDRSSWQGRTQPRGPANDAESWRRFAGHKDLGD